MEASEFVAEVDVTFEASVERSESAAADVIDEWRHRVPVFPDEIVHVRHVALFWSKPYEIINIFTCLFWKKLYLLRLYKQLLLKILTLWRAQNKMCC